MKISHLLKETEHNKLSLLLTWPLRTQPSVVSYAYQELVHAGLTLLQVDPFDGDSLLLGGTVGCLDHGSCSTPWKQTHT